MALILSYAPAPPRRVPLRPVVGTLVTAVAVASSAWIVWFGFMVRVGIEAYVPTGWCGTHIASLRHAQQTLMFNCVVPALFAFISAKLDFGAATSRVALAVAFLSCIVFSGG